MSSCSLLMNKTEQLPHFVARGQKQNVAGSRLRSDSAQFPAVSLLGGRGSGGHCKYFKFGTIYALQINDCAVAISF